MRTARAFIAAVVVSLAIVVPAGPAAAAGPEPPGGWFSLPYFESGYGWFRLVTNHETFGGVRIINATPLTAPYPGPTAEENQGKSLEVTWAAKCRNKEQEAKFKRTVFLPGVPDKVQGSLFSRSLSSYAKSPVKSIELRVNGQTLLKVGKGSGKPVPTDSTRSLTELGGSAFAYGENTVTVVAVKKATKKPHPVAGPYCTGDNIFGVAAELYGEFTADVETLGPSAGGSVSGGSTSAVIPITVTNHGPSHLFTGAGQFSFAASSNQATVTHVFGGVDSGGNPVLTCTNDSFYSDGRGAGKQSICSLPHLGPGQSISFNVLIGFEGLDCPDERIWFNFNSPGYFEDPSTTGNNGSTERSMGRSGC